MPFEMRSGSSIIRGSAVSVSTQADIAHVAKGYESEDEITGRKRQRAYEERSASKVTMYSKQEFREQYCINNKQLDLLDLEKSKKERFLGCLSQYNIDSPCTRTSRSSLLSVCVRRRVPSDENLNTDYAPIQRYPRHGQPSPAPPELYAHDAELECSYFRRRPRSVCSQPDPKRYTWMPEDEDFTRMEWPQSVMEDNTSWPHNYNMDHMASVIRGGSLPRQSTQYPCPAHTPIPPPPPPPPIGSHRPKHVSFARSHTLQTFDDSIMPAALSTNTQYKNYERLLDGRIVQQPEQVGCLPMLPQQQYPPHMSYYPPPAPGGPVMYQPSMPTLQPVRPVQKEQPKILVLDTLKKGVMRTQATQTEVYLSRKPLPPNYLSLSPRTIKRVKMVAAGVQTNGITNGTRRLTKSFSEGGDRLTSRKLENEASTPLSESYITDHDKLHRTQSEEPPRSPRSPTSTTPISPFSSNPKDYEDILSSSIKSTASSQLDRLSELSIMHKQTHEYFQQNFQFIHESDRDDTVEDDIEIIEKSMALNKKNLDFLQQEIAKQTKGEKLKSILSKSTSESSQKTASYQYSKTSTFHSEPSTETSVTTTDESDKNEKEIIIDFEPRPDDEALLFTTSSKNNRKLQKTLSEGEILLDVRKNELQKSSGEGKEIFIMSTSQENVTHQESGNESNYYKYLNKDYDRIPIKDEGIYGFEANSSFSSSDGNVQFEEFHEKYLSYKHDNFSFRSMSFEDNDAIVNNTNNDNSTAKSSPDLQSQSIDIINETTSSIEPIVTKAQISLSPLNITSPCASVESLTVDQSRDHSDGNWNESQTTVLQIDSGTDNGTVISSSDLSSLATSPGALALLTPTSRRKQLLLLQHQQRSSLDTDALDEEFDASQSQSPTSPRNKLDAPGMMLSQHRPSLSPPAVVPNITLPTITKQPKPSRVQKITHAPAIAITYPSLDLGDIPFRRTSSFINKKRERALSPSRRKDLQRRAEQRELGGAFQSPSESSLVKSTSADANLARTDSGKTNTTDISESTTTDDYVTANSDSSKKSFNNNKNNHCPDNKTLDGSSFESGSSLYSSTRTDNVTDDNQIPSFPSTLSIGDDFLVPDLTSPPIPLPDTKVIESTKLHDIKTPRSLDKIDVTENKSPVDVNRSLDFNKKIPIDRSWLKSSSSGSYSSPGSKTHKTENNVVYTSPINNIINIPEDVKTALPELSINRDIKRALPNKIMGSLSDDERSGHYSSSGYYESPVDDDDDDGGLTYKHSLKYRSTNKVWLSEERRRKKKVFALEFSKSYDDSVSSAQEDWNQEKHEEIKSIERISSIKSPTDDKSIEFKKKKTHFVEKPKTVQSSPTNNINIENTIKDKEAEPKKPNERYAKRTKMKAKSPTQSKIILGSKERISHSMKLKLNIPTSDDSSEQYKNEASNGNLSPRKHRRLRESPRRKSVNSMTKSPSGNNIINGMRNRRKNGSNDSISLPGSLPRRKSLIPVVTRVSSLEAEDVEIARTDETAGSRLTPVHYIKSPNASPRQLRTGKDSKFAKAASAESLRSVSPGSDSVFYSEHASCYSGNDAEAKAHCLHCGKEVEIVTASQDPDSRTSRTSHTDDSYTDHVPDIVPAPAGFADSPSCMFRKPANGTRLYKKLEKRYRSEDKSRHYRHRHDIRAKSEERGKDEINKTQDSRIARSAGNSLDKLGGSNASVDCDEHEDYSGSSDTEGHRDDKGVYAAPWWCGNWIMLPNNDDEWENIPSDPLLNPDSEKSEDPTDSETEFNKRYVALTHRLVHRRACVHLVKRQSTNELVKDVHLDSKSGLKAKLEEIFKLMLILWCRQCQVNKLVAPEPCESDKTVIVRKGNEEFGFRIHGSKPVVVSAIEPDTPAETSGLEIGDIVIAVNGINVLDKSHSEVVKIAHAGSEILKLEVARTCEVVASLAHEGSPASLFAGYLWRSAPVRPHHPMRWTRRWFVLKKDNCLYYYKTDSSVHPVGALMLVNYQLTEEEAGKPFGFKLQRGGGMRLSLAADTADASARWRAVLGHAIESSNQRDNWLETTMRNMKLPPSSVMRPDCFGYLMKLGSKWKSWAKRYCVLKDACLYFYNDGNSKSAFGMACLHGYRVQHCAPGGKKYAFEVMPTETKQRHFYFHTESEMDKKRWMAALEYSIDRWMKAG